MLVVIQIDDIGTLALVGTWVHTASLHVVCGMGLGKGMHHPHVVSRTNCGHERERRHLGGVGGPRDQLPFLGTCRSRGGLGAGWSLGR